MELNKLHIQNFLSTRDTTLELNNRGLVLIQGRNLDDFDNNGAGKSTITEALAYVFYGKTLRGLKADEVVHRIPKKNCVVTIDLTDDDGTEYRISRYRKHRENHNNVLIFKNGKNITPKSDRDTNDFIISLIQMDFLTFTSSILYSESSFKFTTSTDSEMKSAFDTMLGFDILNHLQDTAKQRLNSTKNVLESSDEQIKYLKETQEHLLDNIEDYKEKWTQHDNDSKAKIEEYNTELNNAKRELEEHLNSSSDTDEEIAELDELIGKVQKKLDKYKDIDNRISEIKTEISELKATNRTLKSSIDNLEQREKSHNKKVLKYETKIEVLQENYEETANTVGSPCPTCGQPLTRESIKPALLKITDEINDVKELIKEATDEFEKLKENTKNTENTIKQNELKINELETELNKQKERLTGKSDLEDSMRELKDEKAELMAEFKQYNKIKDNLEKSITRIEKQISEQKTSAKRTYEPLIKEAEEKYKECSEDINRINNKTSSLRAEQEKLEFWVKAFSNQGIKSKLLDGITPFLNRRANKYLAKLTDSSIEVKFSTQTQIKSGEYRDKFSLEVINKNGGDKYIGNSGGERKRIDLAVNMALQDLVASRSTKKLDICFYDEVFDALDSTGCEKVIELLQNMSSEKSSIYVITHNDNLKSFFDNVITVVKEKGYSRIESEE